MSLTPLWFFLTEAFAFFLANTSITSAADRRITRTVILDVIISLNGFVCIKLVAEPTGWADIIGFVIGAAVGSYLGMKASGEGTSSGPQPE